MTKIKLIVILSFLGFSYNSFSQNCGVLDSVTFVIVDNGNGTSDYTFEGFFSTTSGGSKSVDVSIYCGSYYFVTNDCVPTTTTQTTKTYGPYTNVTNCTGTLFVDWLGKTNAVCGGSTCGGATGVTPVPVNLVSFNTKRDGDGLVKLNWLTATEINNDRFEIQRKLESEIDFTTIAQVQGAGNSNEIVEYEYVDRVGAVKGKICYQLKQVDYNNEFAYSDIACAEEANEKVITLFPNPASSEVTISTQFDGFEYEVINSIGQIVKIGSVDQYSAKLNTNSLINGIYYMNIKSIDGRGSETVKLNITK